MKMYPDGIIEGTPEEVAAFKHIDAALAAKGKRLAIEAAPRRNPPAKKKRVARARRTAKLEGLSDMIVGLASTHPDGVTAKTVSQYLEVDVKTAYNHLYRLKKLGKLSSQNGTYRTAVAVADPLQEEA